MSEMSCINKDEGTMPQGQEGFMLVHLHILIS